MRTYRYILTALYASDRIKFLLKITQDLQYYRYPTYICINTMTYIHIYIIFFLCVSALFIFAINIIFLISYFLSFTIRKTIFKFSNNFIYSSSLIFFIILINKTRLIFFIKIINKTVLNNLNS